MFDLSEEYLQEIGIATMPEPAKSQLISSIQTLVQNRVNLKLADSLTDDKVSELERISNSIDDAKWWLGENFPKYESSAEFENFKSNFNIDSDESKSIFAQTKWLQVNVPNFALVLQETLDEVKSELKLVNSAVSA